MTLTNLYPLPFRVSPLNNITPFTYRDGTDFMELLERIRLYLNDVFRPAIDAEIARIIAEFNEGIENAENHFTATKNEWLAKFTEFETEVNAALAEATGDIENSKLQWQQKFDLFMLNVIAELEALNDAAMANLINDPTSLAGIAFRENIESIDVYNEFVKPAGLALNGVDNLKAAMDAAADKGRATRRKLYMRAGRWFWPGTVDCSGLNIVGESAGYEGVSGTVIVGDGTNIAFSQLQLAPIANIKMSISRLSFENVQTGIKVRYSVYSHFSDITIKNATGIGFICGETATIGPLWNIFDRVKATSSASWGLNLSGKDWCNSNQFDSCFFAGPNGAVLMNSVSGFGALDNIFRNTEITGNAGAGIVLQGTNRATLVESCFMESDGPSIVIDASTDLTLISNVYGSTKNNVPGYAPSFIEHKSGGANVRVLAGWCTTNNVPEQTNLRFISSAIPASLFLEYISEPRINSDAAGFKIHDETTISAMQKIHRGNLSVRKYLAPEIEVAYADGSKPFKLKRNGTQGGTDLGVQFVNGGQAVWTAKDNQMFIVNGNLATQKSTAATVLGTLARKVQIYDETETAIGFIPIFSGTT